MEKIGKLKLTRLSREELDEREMDAIIGGAASCGCACAYVNYGGSSTTDNSNANEQYGYHSPGMTPEEEEVEECVCNLIGPVPTAFVDVDDSYHRN